MVTDKLLFDFINLYIAVGVFFILLCIIIFGYLFFKFWSWCDKEKLKEKEIFKKEVISEYERQQKEK